PLLYKLAQKPPMSVTTPPPRLSISAFRSRAASVILSQIREQVSRFLWISPAGTLMKTASAGKIPDTTERHLDCVLASVKTTNLEKDSWAKIPESVCSAVAVKMTGSKGLLDFWFGLKLRKAVSMRDCLPGLRADYFFMTSPS